MFWLKLCPRCNGDLYENNDIFGRYIACLQCGHHLTDYEEVFVFGHTSTRAPELPEKVAIAA